VFVPTVLAILGIAQLGMAHLSLADVITHLLRVEKEVKKLTRRMTLSELIAIDRDEAASPCGKTR